MHTFWNFSLFIYFLSFLSKWAFHCIWVNLGAGEFDVVCAWIRAWRQKKMEQTKSTFFSVAKLSNDGAKVKESNHSDAHDMDLSNRDKYILATFRFLMHSSDLINLSSLSLHSINFRINTVTMKTFWLNVSSVRLSISSLGIQRNWLLLGFNKYMIYCCYSMTPDFIRFSFFRNIYI